MDAGASAAGNGKYMEGILVLARLGDGNDGIR